MTCTGTRPGTSCDGSADAAATATPRTPSSPSSASTCGQPSISSTGSRTRERHLRPAVRPTWNAGRPATTSVTARRQGTSCAGLSPRRSHALSASRPSDGTARTAHLRRWTTSPLGHRPPSAARRHAQVRRPPRRPAVAPLCPVARGDLPTHRRPHQGDRRSSPPPPRRRPGRAACTRRRTGPPTGRGPPQPCHSRPDGSPWLFPGGQPGRPISVWAMGEVSANSASGS